MSECGARFSKTANGRTWIVVAVLFCSLLSGQSVYAQAGLRESLERLDRNNDGIIHPEEITTLARPYMERILAARRLSVDQPNRIDQIQEAARSYFGQRNGGFTEDAGTVRGQGNVKPLAPENDEVLVPQFGLAVVRYPYTRGDLEFADTVLRQFDANRDGFLDVREATAANNWARRNPFDDDYDKDDRLSRMELTQRYARRRLLRSESAEIRRKRQRAGSDVRSSSKPRPVQDQWWVRGGDNYWLTALLMARFDTNRNRTLDLEEAKELGIPVGQIDVDRDGELSREEMYSLVSALQAEAGSLDDDLPSWFYERDANRDGQVAMPEFTEEWTREKILEFRSLDTNGDGLLTVAEVSQSRVNVGGSFFSGKAEILPPGKTVVSEIEVEEDFVIYDLDVEVSITHSVVSLLDGYLEGPGGQRVELFTGVGGSGDHFDHTVFDDDSGVPIVKAKPPFDGTFQPEALTNRQPGLKQFNGQRTKGTWQLIIRGTRNDRFGMLHDWGLIIKPLETQ